MRSLRAGAPHILLARARALARWLGALRGATPSGCAQDPSQPPFYAWHVRECQADLTLVVVIEPGAAARQRATSLPIGLTPPAAGGAAGGTSKTMGKSSKTDYARRTVALRMARIAGVAHRR